MWRRCHDATARLTARLEGLQGGHSVIGRACPASISEAISCAELRWASVRASSWRDLRLGQRFSGRGRLSAATSAVIRALLASALEQLFERRHLPRLDLLR